MTPRLTALVALVVGALMAADPAGAEPADSGDCLPDYCAEDVVEIPANGSHSGGDGSAEREDRTGSGASTEHVSVEALPQCTDVRVCGYPIADLASGLTPVAVPEGPDALAQTIRVRLEGNLPAPVVSSDPALDTAAIVRRPTFVEVENWTGTVNDQECYLLLCVSVTAVPSLTFSPGEPGAPVVSCAGAGTRFDASGPRSDMQASTPGACAYAYERRTGVEGRPEAWPGVVTVTWELTWSSTTGRGGSLEPVSKSADVSRAVHEVQVVVE